MSNTETKHDHGKHGSKDHGCCGGDRGTTDRKADPAQATRAASAADRMTDEAAHQHGGGSGCCGSKKGSK